MPTATQSDTSTDELLTDRFGRSVTYLRVSVTDRCNFRCVYCAPEEGYEHGDRPELLTFDEIEYVVRTFVKHGVRKVRLTGGEPLVRGDIPELVDRLSRLEGLEHVAMTTNAFLLERQVEALADAGLDSLNISLDSLDSHRFEEMTRVGNLERVVRGIDAALGADFVLVKLNTVVVRGFNDDELDDLVRFAAARRTILRFIEFMPLGRETAWSDGDASSCVPADEIRETLRRRWDLAADDDSYGAGPARYWRLRGPGMPSDGYPLGIIGAVTECFCDSCNRMRLTPQGQLRACLADDRELSVRAPLRTIGDPEERRAAVEGTIARALGGKRASHDFELDGESVTETPMTAIGG